MKKATLILALGMAVAAMAAITPLTWKTTSLSLGQIKAGEKQVLEFEFTNDTQQAITILEAKGSCGCTDVSYSKEAISPGESATISAAYTGKKTGAFKKNIRIKTSASEEFTYLYFSGEIVE